MDCSLDFVEVGLDVAIGGVPALGVRAAEAGAGAVREVVADVEVVAFHAGIDDPADAHALDVEDVVEVAVGDESGRLEGIDEIGAGHWDLLRW